MMRTRARSETSLQCSRPSSPSRARIGPLACPSSPSRVCVAGATRLLAWRALCACPARLTRNSPFPPLLRCFQEAAAKQASTLALA
eukprot:758449-Pleurochrysis_carterae.AAC.1